MIQINEKKEKWILQRLEEFLPRYCEPCKIEFPVETEKCSWCGTEVMQRIFPHNGAHGFGVEWGISHWIRKQCDNLTQYEITLLHRENVKKRFGHAVILGNYVNSYDAARLVVPDQLEQDRKDFLLDQINDQKMACVDGEYYPIDYPTLESYHPDFEKCESCNDEKHNCNCPVCERCNEAGCESCDLEKCENCEEWIDICSCDPF